MYELRLDRIHFNNCDFQNQHGFFPGPRPVSGAFLSAVLRDKEFAAEQCIAEASNSSQKYQRVGLQIFVPFNYDEVTIVNLQ